VFTTGGNARTTGIGEASQYEASKCEVIKASSDKGREPTKEETFWEVVKKYIWPYR
jgi:hypothetical protein